MKDFVFSSVMSAYHYAARLVKLVLSITTEFRCVRTDSKLKRRRSAAQISVI